MAHCVRCLLPDSVPGADLDQAHLCALCRDFLQQGSQDAAHEQQRQRWEADLEQTLESCRGTGEYDVLVNLSGGKDSCYLLHKLSREYKLNVLAFTTDMNVPPVAWANIRRTVEKLQVPHLVYTPPKDFYRRLFRHLLQNQEARGAVRTVCYVCAPLFEGYALKVAVEKRIPLVVAGYSPGQPDPQRMKYEFSKTLLWEQDWTPAGLRESGLFSPQELKLFWNPRILPADVLRPRYLAPFHAWKYNQEQVMKLVVELGLISNSKHASPVHSNCPVNWLLMYSDLKNLGYNPYQPEFSKLIREGKASRSHWRVMIPIVNAMIRLKVLMGRNVRESMRWLGLSESELCVTQPLPAGEEFSAMFPGPGPRGLARVELGPRLAQAMQARHAGAK